MELECCSGEFEKWFTKEVVMGLLDAQKDWDIKNTYWDCWCEAYKFGLWAGSLE